MKCIHLTTILEYIFTNCFVDLHKHTHYTCYIPVYYFKCVPIDIFQKKAMKKIFKTIMQVWDYCLIFFQKIYMQFMLQDCPCTDTDVLRTRPGKDKADTPPPTAQGQVGASDSVYVSMSWTFFLLKLNTCN